MKLLASKFGEIVCFSDDEYSLRGIKTGEIFDEFKVVDRDIDEEVVATFQKNMLEKDGYDFDTACEQAADDTLAMIKIASNFSVNTVLKRKRAIFSRI